MIVLSLLLLSACSDPTPWPYVANATCTPLGPADAGSASDAVDAPTDTGGGHVRTCAPRPELGLTYEIYVRSFQDSDADGIGDLAGVQARLDHLEGLGIETIWLMPVFPAVGPAGYDVEDFDRVRNDYGDEADLAALVEDARGRGMRVLLDLPFNHVARTHPWFATAEVDLQSDERGRFVFADTRWDEHRWFPAAGGGYYYGFFGAELPDLDWTDGVVQDRMFDVFARWVGVADGYRLDAVIPLVEAHGAITGTEDTHRLLAQLYAHVKRTNPDAAVLAEAAEYEDGALARYLGAPDAPEADRVLDFPRREALLAGITAGDPNGILAHLAAQEDAGSLGATAPFLQSHDVSRLPAHVPDARARRLLQVLQLTLPGDPILYYGEELDLSDATTATGQDYAWRAPMPWDGSRNGGFTEADVAWMTPDPAYLDGKNVEAASTDPESLLHLLRALACVRAELTDASWEAVRTESPSVLAYERWTEEGRLLVVANLSDRATQAFAVDARGGFRALTGGEGVDAGDGLVVPGLGAYSYALYAEEIASLCAVPGPVAEGGGRARRATCAHD